MRQGGKSAASWPILRPGSSIRLADFAPWSNAADQLGPMQQLVNLSCVNILADTGRLRDRMTVFLHAIEMKPNRLADFPLRFLDGRPRRYTTRKIGHISRIVAICLFDDNRKTHQMYPFS